jgi:hypothetical protein
MKPDRVRGMTFPPEKRGAGPQAAISVVIVVDRLTVGG